jgi:hypothetical protein
MKLLSLVTASLVWSTQRRECQAQTVKVFFDRMMAILLHQFDGCSFSETCFETQQNRRSSAKASTELLSLVTASLVGSTWRRECPAVKVFFDQMAAIPPHQFDGLSSEILFETQPF